MARSLPDQPRATVDELCDLYDNENVHTRYVTQMALSLFDATAHALGLTRYDRRLLEAATRLHDVGYAVDPARHARKSVDIVREEGLDGFQPRQVEYVLAIMGLHQNGKVSEGKNPLVKKLADPRRAIRLASILRIADGLDQSHIQDASITGIRRVAKRIIVTVHAPWSPDTITRADAKATLWRSVMPLDISFERHVTRERMPAFPVTGGLTALEAARRLIYLQYKIMKANESGCRQGETPEPLHDFRVALRRLRAALRLFRKPLAQTEAKDIDRKLRAVAQALGPPRDADVWWLTLQSIERELDMAQNRTWKKYMQYQQLQREPHRAHVRQVLDGSRYRNLMTQTVYFLRIGIHRAIREAGDEAHQAEPWSAKKILMLARSIYEADIPGGAWDVEEFHALRRACRRCRYWTEFMGPALGPRTRSWARLMKDIADVLGDLHDADVALERLAYEPVSPPRALVAEFRARRANALRDVDAIWAKVKDEERFRKLRRELE